MEIEKRNLLLNFIELSGREGLVENKVTSQKEKLFKILGEVEKVLLSTNNSKLNVELEGAVTDVIELTQHQYFEYGRIANVIEEDYQENYDPFKRIDETVKE